MVSIGVQLYKGDLEVCWKHAFPYEVGLSFGLYYQICAHITAQLKKPHSTMESMVAENVRFPNEWKTQNNNMDRVPPNNTSLAKKKNCEGRPEYEATAVVCIY